MKKQKQKKIRGALWIGVGLMLAIVGVIGGIAYNRLYSPNVRVNENGYLFIPTGSDFEELVKQLVQQKVIADEATFRWTARQMKYDTSIKPGRYRLVAGMTNRSLVAMLRSGKQAPVKVVFNNVRTTKDLAEKVETQLELTASSLLNLLSDRDYLKEFGLTPENALVLFIPNTYEFYWNTSADKFIRRMKFEYDRFWSENRKKKAATAGLSPVQVSILAAIVQQESNQESEKPVIAGVYLNRLRKGWKLEADPTLVFASGDFNIRRVLNEHKAIDSPYNTYLYGGLPPGPICLPSPKSIDAVLGYARHNYMYFCAREDFSGYHNFAATYAQHLTNARKFQQAMNRRGIRS
ncbi:MAG: endolytic transglycosylase MltG [Bacteroidota bacterium]